VFFLGLPLYKIVASQIKQKIFEQLWTTKLPSENELCKQFQVSRITLRRAIQDLCDEGLVVKRQGLGMFLERDDYELLTAGVHDRLFTDLEYKLLQVVRNVRPYKYISHMLKLEPQDNVVEAQRLAFYKDVPADFLKIYIPEKYYHDRFFEDVVGNGLVIPSMKQLGISISRTVLTVELIEHLLDGKKSRNLLKINTYLS
jgi:DNA-binding GntR family transcriptional regulator